MRVDIKQTPLGGDLRDFLDIVDYIYRDDPHFVRPLDMDLKGKLNPKNPFFEHAEGTIFTAYRNGWCVGRCTAQIDRHYIERYDDEAGFFGYLDTIDDEEVAQALLGAAAQWLKARGCKRMRGPFMLSTNDEVGCLVDGFDTPPAMMMSHHRPYQGRLIEAAGLSKTKDAYAWRYVIGNVPKRAQKAHAQISSLPNVVCRHVDTQNIKRDVGIVMDIYNDAWSDNWGFIPMTEAELSKMAKEVKLILDPRLTLIVEVDGQPAGVCLAFPNINEVIPDLNGKLFPLGLPKLLWRLKVKRPKSARLIILGIRKEFRNSKEYAGLSTFMYVEANNSSRAAGYEWGELSWTLEDNHPVNLGIKFMGGKIYKRYRLYEREL